jgi:hypothetical protein
VRILLDAKKLTISIDEQRLAEISQLVLDWLTKQVCNKKDLQKISSVHPTSTTS